MLRRVIEDVIKEALLDEAKGVKRGPTGKQAWVGKRVIVRSRNEGINAGVVEAIGDGWVELSDCRRLWSHKPKDPKDVWYEGVAQSGLSPDSRVGTISVKLIVEDFSLTLCTQDAWKSISEAPVNGK